MMIRLVLRLAFWGCLLVAVLPGTRKSGVYDGTLSLAKAGDAVHATLLDLSNFCSRNGGTCETGLAAFADASALAKASMLTAYQGVRGQYDEPDRTTMTGSVKNQKAK
jgi:hypothetical protein